MAAVDFRRPLIPSRKSSELCAKICCLLPEGTEDREVISPLGTVQESAFLEEGEEGASEHALAREDDEGPP